MTELSREQIENFRIALKTHHPSIRSAHDWEIDALCDRALEPSPEREGQMSIPVKPNLDWLRKIAALCPNMDGTEDMVGVVRGVHGAILATAPAPRATEQARIPVESAPKDGTHLLMSPKGGVISEAWWRADILGKFCWGGSGWSYAENAQPTHWMPLPPSPKEKE